MAASDIFLGFIAILFPPLPVWIKTGICSVDSLINLLLLCLGYIPGLLHSWYIIAKFPDSSDYESLPQDIESGRVTYVYVQSSAQPRPQRSQQGGYGTTVPMAAPNVHQEQNGTWTESGTGEGSSGGAAVPPPSYAQAVKGDNKVQTSD